MPVEEENDLRATLEQAFDKDTGETVTDAGNSSDEGGTQQNATGDGSATPENIETAAGETTTEEEPGTQAKFLPPEGSEDEREGSGDAGGEVRDGEQPAGDTASEPQERVPVAWRGEAKQKWSETPAEVRQEVLRREKEVNEVLRDSANSRQFQEAFNRTMAPFQQFFAADGVDPLTSARNMMQTAAVLRVGSPVQKAQTIANIIRQFGVDVYALDSALTPGEGGQPVNGGMSPEVQQYLDSRLAPVNQFMTGLQSTAAERNKEQSRSVTAEIEAFSEDPAHPFFENVRDVMGDLMEMADRRNQKMTMQEAYDKAVALDPKLSDLANKQREAQKAQEDTRTLEAKKRAAVSLRSTSPPPVSQESPKDLRGFISQAWDQHSQGGV